MATAEVYRAASIVVRSPIVFPLETDGGVIDLDEDDRTPDGVVYTFRPMAQGISVLVPRTYQGNLFEPATLSQPASWRRSSQCPMRRRWRAAVATARASGCATTRRRTRSAIR